jgi:hypothetical protein
MGASPGRLAAPRALAACVIGVAAIVASGGAAFAQYTNPYTGATFNNSFSRNIDTFSTMQQNLLRQSIAIQAQNSAMARSAAARPPTSAGIAPPAGTVAPGNGTAPAAHLAINATDFVPAEPGHPVVERFLDQAKLPPDQRAQLGKVIYGTFTQVDTQLRKNNIAASMGLALGTSIYAVNGKIISDAESNQLIFTLNDMIARTPEFARMSRQEKQTTSDSLILVSSLILAFKQAGQRDPQLKQQSVALAQGLLQHLTGSPTGR